MMAPLKALSLTQPWATLVSIAAKGIETRSWSTRYRGELAIHAARGFPGVCQALCERTLPGSVHNRFWHALKAAGYEGAASLPRGAIVAVVRLVGCYSTDCRWGDLPPAEGTDERAFGDYASGRWLREHVEAKRYVCRVQDRTLTAIRLRVRAVRPDAVILDFIQHLRPDRDQRGMSRYEYLTAGCETLAGMARETGREFALLLCSQVNRAAVLAQKEDLWVTRYETDEELLRRHVWPPEPGAPEWAVHVDGATCKFATEMDALRWALARLLRRADWLAAVASAVMEAERHIRVARLVASGDRAAEGGATWSLR